MTPRNLCSLRRASNQSAFAAAVRSERHRIIMNAAACERGIPGDHWKWQRGRKPGAVGIDCGVSGSGVGSAWRWPNEISWYRRKKAGNSISSE